MSTTYLYPPQARMTETVFSSDDLRQMAELGILPEEVERQLVFFRQAPPYTRVLRPCRPGDGIRQLSEAEEPWLLARFEGAVRDGRIGKLVPASGAASRMFKPLLAYLEGHGDEPAGEVRIFFDNLDRFAFREALAAAMARHGLDLEQALELGDHRTILEHLLTERGLGYRDLPKGLLLFHRYPDGPRTPFEEHLVEAADLARSAEHACRLHFTISPQHEAGFHQLLAEVRPRYEERFGVRFEVSFSFQKRSTDTVAVDLDDRPFRQDDGTLLFRPGGHGALLDNLDALARDGWDIVLLKNIDNVVPDGRKPLVAQWKRLLTGQLLALQDRAFRLLERLEEGSTNALDEAAAFVETDLSRPQTPELAGAPDAPDDARRHRH